MNKQKHSPIPKIGKTVKLSIPIDLSWEELTKQDEEEHFIGMDSFPGNFPVWVIGIEGEGYNLLDNHVVCFSNPFKASRYINACKNDANIGAALKTGKRVFAQPTNIDGMKKAGVIDFMLDYCGYDFVVDKETRH